MTILDAAPLSVALAIAYAAVELAKAAIAKRSERKNSVNPDACEDCRATVAMISKAGERTEKTLGEIRDGVRDLVRLTERG